MGSGRWRSSDSGGGEEEEGEGKKKSFVFWQVGSHRGCSAVITPPTPTDALDLIQESNWVGDTETDCSGAV